MNLPAALRLWPFLLISLLLCSVAMSRRVRKARLSDVTSQLPGRQTDTAAQVSSSNPQTASEEGGCDGLLATLVWGIQITQEKNWDQSQSPRKGNPLALLVRM